MVKLLIYVSKTWHCLYENGNEISLGIGRFLDIYVTRNLITIISKTETRKIPVNDLCIDLKKTTRLIRKDGKNLTKKKRLKNCYLVMQDVNHQLFTGSVEEEILLGIHEKDSEKESEKIMKSMDLLLLKELHPISLSGGQKQRVAIASDLASGKDLLIFDEPTSGLDYHHMIDVAENLKRLSQL